MDHALISSNLLMQKLGRRGPLFLFYIKRALKNSGEILLFGNCKCRHAIQVLQVSAPDTKHKSEICVEPNFCGGTYTWQKVSFLWHWSKLVSFHSFFGRSPLKFLLPPKPLEQRLIHFFEEQVSVLMFFIVAFYIMSLYSKPIH